MDIQNNQHEADKMLNVLSNILDSIDNFVYVSDMETHEILFVNKKMRDVFDIDYDTTGLICWEVIQEGMTERCPFCPINRLEKDPTPFEWEASNSKTGRTYKCLDSVIDWDDGKKVHMHFATDVTEVLNAEQDVRDANRRLEVALDASGAGVWEMDFEKNLYTYDERSGRLLDFDTAAGTSTIDAIIDHLENIFMGEGLELLPRLRARELFIDWPTHDIKLTTQSGEFRALRIFGRAKHDADGKVLNIIGMNTDITDRVKIEDELRAAKQTAVDEGRAEADERTRIMLDATPLAASFWDEDGNMLDCNMECVRLFGIEKKEDYIEHFLDLNPEFQPDGSLTEEKTAREIKAAFETGYRKFEWMYLTVDGQPLPVETTLVRVSMKDEYRLAAYSRDLREIKASEKARKAATEHSMEMEIQAKLAIAASEAKSQFLSNMSHEIRTPMNAIIGMTTLLNEEPLNEKQKKYVDNVLVSATSLMGIINDILDFSKIEARKMSLDIVDYDFSILLQNIYDFFNFSSQNKGIDFEMDLDDSLPKYVSGDDIRLRQILVNIIGNAIKFTEKGKVKLIVRKRDDRLYFRVEDTGIGIHNDDLSKIFNEFDRLDMSNQRYINGTGLGLPIAKTLVELMGGSIRVESEYEKGSAFYFDIPYTPGKSENCKDTDDENTEDISAPDAVVLVVDDNDINLSIVSAMLELYDIKCDTATNGVEAIEKISEKKYDLVFMDQMMPEMDGVEATKRLRKTYDQDELIIIALTANAIDGAKEMLIEIGMNDYLSKPIDREPLITILKKWLPDHKIVSNHS